MTRLAGGKPIPLPKGEAGRIAAMLIKQFKPCDGDNVVPDFVCTKSRPIHAGRYVEVCAVLTDDSPARVPGREHVPGGHFRPAHPRSPSSAGGIQVRVTETCRPRALWNKEMRSVIQHELAHAADPSIHMQHARVIRARETRTPIPHHGATPDTDFCGYVNKPIEITARIAQVAHELSAMTARAAIRQRLDYEHPDDPARAHEILYKSTTYNAVEGCLTPKNKRKFLQLAARLWQSGRYGTPPRAGQSARRPTPPTPPKLPRDRPRRQR